MPQSTLALLTEQLWRVLVEAEALRLHIAEGSWVTPEQLEAISSLLQRDEQLADELRLEAVNDFS